jgi:glycosyltransferase involved in cell wall biosynthesis
VGKKDDLITKDDTLHDIIHRLGNRVVFTGIISDDDLIKEYKVAKLFIFPSLYEGFGIPPLESQALSTAVLLSDIDVLREVCQGSALYFDPYDVYDLKNKIEGLLTDEKKIESLIKKGSKNITRFSWKNSADKMISILDKHSLGDNK